jgi:NADPH2:quinone reductase
VQVFTMPIPALSAAAEHVNRLLTDKVLTHPIAARFPLTEIAAAHRLVESGEAVGKVLIAQR